MRKIVFVEDQPVESHGIRQKRNSLCAARCIGLRKGFRGGYCTHKAVSLCRR